MRCPKCDSNNVYVTNTMTSEDNEVLRRRNCSDCGYIFKTVETVVVESKDFKKKYMDTLEAKHPTIKKAHERRSKVEPRGPDQYDFERRTCPFCGQAHIGERCIQTICVCGAKYYPCTEEWLNCETGEIKKGSE